MAPTVVRARQVEPPSAIVMAVTGNLQNLTIGDRQDFRAPFKFKLIAVKASLTSVPLDGGVEINILLNGTTIFNSGYKLTIDDNTSTSLDAAVPYQFSTHLTGVDNIVDDDAIFEIEVDNVGTTDPGGGLKVTFIVQNMSNT